MWFPGPQLDMLNGSRLLLSAFYHLHGRIDAFVKMVATHMLTRLNVGKRAETRVGMCSVVFAAFTYNPVLTQAALVEAKSLGASTASVLSSLHRSLTESLLLLPSSFQAPFWTLPCHRFSTAAWTTTNKPGRSGCRRSSVFPPRRCTPTLRCVCVSVCLCVCVSVCVLSLWILFFAHGLSRRTTPPPPHSLSPQSRLPVLLQAHVKVLDMLVNSNVDKKGGELEGVVIGPDDSDDDDDDDDDDDGPDPDADGVDFDGTILRCKAPGFGRA